MISLHTRQDEHNGETVKKPYFTPRVQIYGDLRQITQSIGQNGMGDGNPDKKSANQMTAP